MSIPYALLALLSHEPKFGQRLKDEFEANTGNIWPLNVGQVYTTLQRLERDGFVRASEVEGEAPSQKLYALTNPGRHELHNWFLTPPNLEVPPRDEVVIKVMVALTVEEVDIFAVLQTHRRQLLQSMQRFTKFKRARADDLALELVVDSELFRLEATVRWIDTCESRLRRGATLAKPTSANSAVPKTVKTTSRAAAAAAGGVR